MAISIYTTFLALRHNSFGYRYVVKWRRNGKILKLTEGRGQNGKVGFSEETKSIAGTAVRKTNPAAGNGAVLRAVTVKNET